MICWRCIVRTCVSVFAHIEGQGKLWTSTPCRMRVRTSLPNQKPGEIRATKNNGWLLPGPASVRILGRGGDRGARPVPPRRGQRRQRDLDAQQDPAPDVRHDAEVGPVPGGPPPIALPTARCAAVVCRCVRLHTSARVRSLCSSSLSAVCAARTGRLPGRPGCLPCGTPLTATGT